MQIRQLLALAVLLILCRTAAGQEKPASNSFRVELNDYAKDERFNKFQITLALFMCKNDTILSMDFEDLRPELSIPIKKPTGYMQYAYGHIFFTGTTNPKNPGYVSVLVGNPFNRNPHLYVDQNQNFDFTDEEKLVLPYFDEAPVEFELSNSSNPQGKIKISLLRNKLFGKADFKQYMDEYYAYTYPNRKFPGIEYTYREQRYLTRAGTFRSEKDSFRIALYDANSNGIYNDSDTDKVVFINYADTVFDATNPLNYTVLKSSKTGTYFEKNGLVYEVSVADPAGKFLEIKESDNQTGLGRIAIGKRVPNIQMYLADGKKIKMRKLRRQEVYFYFADKGSKNFDTDTLLLRQIAALDTNKLKVVCVLYLKKSYDLNIFLDHAKPNYLLVNGSKSISEKLGIRSLPQSLYLGKRRRVKQYGLKPNEFLRTYLSKTEK